MCLSTPSTPKYDPPVTLEAPLPEETPGVLEEPGDISTGRYRSKANRRGTQMFRTKNNSIGSSYPIRPIHYTPGPNGELPGGSGFKRPGRGPGGQNPNAIPVLSSDPGKNSRPHDVGPGGTNPNATRSLETRSTASTKKKNVSANPGLTISRR